MKSINYTASLYLVYFSVVFNISPRPVYHFEYSLSDRLDEGVISYILRTD